MIYVDPVPPYYLADFQKCKTMLLHAEENARMHTEEKASPTHIYK